MLIWKMLETLLDKGIAVVILSLGLSDSLSLADRLLTIDSEGMTREIRREDFSSLHRRFRGVIFMRDINNISRKIRLIEKMRITDAFLREVGEKQTNFSDGIIMPDGDYRLIEEGHLQTLMNLLPESDNEIWKMIPEYDSPLFWMVEKTGCVLTDYNNSIGMHMTPAQKEVFDALVRHNIITPEYFDLTKQREMVRKKQNT